MFFGVLGKDLTVSLEEGSHEEPSWLVQRYELYGVDRFLNS